MTDELDPRIQRSQQALMTAGLELLNRNGQASLSDIALHAGVGRATLYRQYEDREALVLALAHYCLERINEVTASIVDDASSALNAIGLIFERVMPLREEMSFLMHMDRLLEDNPALATISEHQRKEMCELIALAKKEGSIAKDLPTSWVMNLMDGLFVAAWVQQRQEGTSAQRAAALAFDSFCNGVALGKRRSRTS